MKRSIDAMGRICPEPVIMTRKAVAAGEIDEIEVIVDNEPARENVIRFLRFAGASAPRVSSTEGVHTISASVTPEMTAKASGGEPAPAREEEPGPAAGAARYADKVLFFSADQLGRGDEALGKLLIKGVLFALSEMPRLPRALVFMNSGVRLAAERDETIELLRAIEAKGVEILVCGTCLDFYRLKDFLRAGRISNMYEITERLVAADVVTVS